MTAQALVFDKNDNLYVATAPDGKVYKVTPLEQSPFSSIPKPNTSETSLRLRWHAFRRHR